MAKQIIIQHYRRIIAQWPTDLLRPSVSFQSAIQLRISTRLMTPTPSSTSSSAAAAAAASSPPQPQNNIKANEAQVTIPSSTITSAANTSPTRDGEIYKATTASSGFDEKAELEQINVLYSLLENRYTRKYPLSEKIMRPASQPEYYENLVRELDEAPGRSWWAATVKRWKGFLRFS